MAVFDFDIEQLDAINAFINSNIEGEIYIKLFDGYKKKGKYFRLLKTLYNLKKFPRLWLKKIKKFFKKQEFI